MPYPWLILYPLFFRLIVTALRIASHCITRILPRRSHHFLSLFFCLCVRLIQTSNKGNSKEASDDALLTTAFFCFGTIPNPCCFCAASYQGSGYSQFYFFFFFLGMQRFLIERTFANRTMDGFLSDRNPCFVNLNLGSPHMFLVTVYDEYNSSFAHSTRA